MRPMLRSATGDSRGASRSTRESVAAPIATNSSSIASRVGGSERGGDGAEDIVEAAALDIEAGNRPAAFASMPDDRVGDRLTVVRKNRERGVAIVDRRLDRGDAGKLLQFGGDRGHIDRSQIE